MKRSVARLLMRSDWAWEFSRRYSTSPIWLHQRSSLVRKSVRKKCDAILKRREVVDGPFAGLKYAESASVGSTFWPKLFGTYESELTGIFRSFASRSYDAVVDVGYAEGFYLLGLGRLFQQARLVGFDPEQEAKRLCTANAGTNQIAAQRLSLLGAFDPEAFGKHLGQRTLCIVDCEGVENEVVQSTTTQQRKHADWIIETHDHLVPGTSARLQSWFEPTHDLQWIHTDQSLEPKLKLLPSDVTSVCDRYEQEAIVDEGRLASQSWLVATRRAA